MRLARVALLVVAVAGISCVHTQKIEPPSTEPLPAVWHDRAGVTVSSSIGGLLRDGAERLIQQRLIALGLLQPGQMTGRLDEQTTAALRTFQARAELAQTGLPSYETVSRLGLPLDRIFRASQEPPGDRDRGRGAT